MVKPSAGERIFRAANYALLGIVGLCCLFPFLYVVSVSLTPLAEVIKHGGFLLVPTGFTLDAYLQVFLDDYIPGAFLNTVMITAIGTALSLTFTLFMAFGLVKKQLPGKRVYIMAVVFTMLFSGGIIPTFLVVKELGLLNTMWALILPTLISPFNLLIVKTFLEQLPEELEEAAMIDGCGDLRILLQIVVPLCGPMLITIGLFYGVYYWNLYFPAILYITDFEHYPLQVALQQLLVNPDPMEMIMLDGELPLPPETMKMAAVVVSTLPVVAVYPFLQKYFVKGATLGAVKQ